MLISLLLTLSACAFCIVVFINACHMFQLESYKTKEYFKWVADKGSVRVIYTLAMGFIYLVASSIVKAASVIWLSVTGWVLYAGFMAGAVLFAVKFYVRNAKTPLKYTWRVKRMFITAAILLLALGALCTFGGAPLMCVPVMASMILIIAVNCINSPIENMVKRRFLNEAKSMLDKRTDLIKIGITGSYGKTSTKYILQTILSEKYNVLYTPGSFNTPMGVTRIVREQLNDSHEVFIAEMGAKNIGDIAELVDLVHPTYGIITSVGPCHLESFKTIDNVANTKYELIEGLPENGCAFFPNDHAYTKALFDKTSIDKILYAVGDEGDIFADNIENNANGSSFDIHYNDTCFRVTTKLLGKHNVMNIMGCVALALELGLNDEQIKAGISKIEPVEHRLQLIANPANGVTVIDDAFNSNPAGAKAAIDVISTFPGRKIVVTPGMIELGSVEEEENYNFGAHMCGKVDYVFLVGEKQTKPIYNGLTENGFETDRLFVVSSLAEATQRMGTLLVAGDVVLFENDLPDNYNE